MKEKKLTDDETFIWFLEGSKWKAYNLQEIPDLIRRLQSENVKQKAEIERLTLAVEELKGENKVIHKENDELLGKIERLTKENSNVISMNDALYREKAELQKQVDELTEENGYLKQCADNFLADYQKAQKQVDELTEERENIDVVINGDSIVILNEKNFENIFNYFEAAKKMVDDAKPQIQNWTFLTSVDVFFNKATAGKTRTLRLANALKNSKTDWSKISSKTVKDVLTGDERFVSITFDENDQIVCTDSNADLIIDIIREVYSKQLFTEEIIETKGV